MIQSAVENQRNFEPHAATEEEIQRALQQETKDNRLKNVGRSILKILMLPFLLVVFALKWIGTFCVRLSAWIFYIAAGLMAILSVIYLVQGDGRNLLISCIFGITCFLFPILIEVTIIQLSAIQIYLYNFIKLR